MRKRMIVAMACAMCMTSFVGCSKKDTTDHLMEMTSKEIEYTYEVTSMDDWKTSLPQNGNGLITAQSIRGLEVTNQGELSLQISYEPRDYKNSYDCWMMGEPYDSLAYVDTEAMYTYFSSVENLSIQVANDISMSEFGEEQGSIFVAYTYLQDSNSGPSMPDQAICFHFGAVTGNGYQYVKIDGMDMLFVAGEAEVNALLQVDPFDMVLRVVNVVKMDTVSSLKAAGKDCYCELNFDGSKYQMNGKSCSMEEYNDFYTECMSVFISDRLPMDYVIPQDSECLMALSYERNVEDAPDIYVNYYVYNDLCAVAEINGKPLFLVERENVEEVLKKLADK